MSMRVKRKLDNSLKIHCTIERPQPKRGKWFDTDSELNTVFPQEMMNKSVAIVLKADIKYSGASRLRDGTCTDRQWR